MIRSEQMCNKKGNTVDEHRQHYRKKLRLTGYVVRDEGEQAFKVMDLSTGGMKAHFEDNPLLIVDRPVHIRLPELKLAGTGVPARVARAAKGGYDVGFDFTALDGVEGNTYRYRAGEE